MSKFIQTHFFHPSTFSLPTKQKWGKINFFLSSHFSTPPTKQTLSDEKKIVCPCHSQKNCDKMYIEMYSINIIVIIVGREIFEPWIFIWRNYTFHLKLYIMLHFTPCRSTLNYTSCYTLHPVVKFIVNLDENSKFRVKSVIKSIV